MPYPGDRAQFRNHHQHGDDRRDMEIRNEEWQRVADAADHRHKPTDQAAHPGMAAAGEAAVIGERLGKSHADAGAERGCQSTRKAKCDSCRANAAAKTGASVETDPSMRPASPGWTICRTKSLRRASSSSRRAAASGFDGESVVEGK